MKKYLIKILFLITVKHGISLGHIHGIHITYRRRFKGIHNVQEMFEKTSITYKSKQCIKNSISNFACRTTDGMNDPQRYKRFLKTFITYKRRFEDIHKRMISFLHIV